MPGPRADDIPYAIVEERTFVRRVYAWMTGGLTTTALVALFVASQPAIYLPLTGSPLILFGILIGELLLVGYLAARVNAMRPGTAGAVFVAYSALNGLVFSLMFLAFGFAAISRAFFVTAGTFGLMTAYGWLTRKDLTSIGHLCGMAVIGIFIALIVNLFLASSTVHFVISIVGVLAFVGLTAYDTQRIRKIHQAGSEHTDADRRAAVIGALHLYLDFINLFLFILYLFGGRRD
ncbi:MAG: Bax inhibitor-1/YccA family protein [Planctomycetota bacterium]